MATRPLTEPSHRRSLTGVLFLIPTTDVSTRLASANTVVPL